MPSCLEGIKVVEFSEGWRAAPLAGRLLAELGAEVVKVEIGKPDSLRDSLPNIEGTNNSYAFALLHCNKKSIMVSSLTPQVERIIKTSDAVLIDVPYAREKGIYDQLTNDLSTQAMCCISPFGLTGPRAGYVGSDFIVQAASGVMATTGQANATPMRVGIPFAEHVGALFAVNGILGAFEYRRRTGKGQVIDISLHDTLVSYLSTFAPHVFVMGKKPSRMGSQHPIAVPWNIYRASDGYVTICALTDKMWVSLAKAMGKKILDDPEYSTQAQRSKKRDEIDPIVAKWVANKTVQEVIETLDAAEVPVAIIQTVAGLLKDAQFCIRNMVLKLREPSTNENVVTTGSIYTMSECPGTVLSLGPKPGEHNIEYGIRI
jgi:crotonobetainyl-CoA:carnitine CoA-transferase CaiB-like acyl-CoA transferase